MMQSIKKICSILLILTILITGLPNQVYADDGIGDAGNSGNGESNGNSNSAYTWNQNQSGFRLSIVDSNMKQVSNAVDILFSEHKNYYFGGTDGVRNLYTNSRSGALSNSTKDWSTYLIQDLKDESLKDNDPMNDIKTVPQFPISFSGNRAYAGGEDFKEWFLKGKSSLSNVVIYTPPTTYTPSTKNKPIENNSTATLAPVLNDVPTPIDDMTYDSYMLFMLKYFPSYRLTYRSESFEKVIYQGYYEHAKTIINSQVSVIKLAMARTVTKENVSAADAMKEQLLYAWNYIKAVAKSNAEAIFIYCSLIDTLGGKDYDFNYLDLDNITISNNDGVQSIKVSKFEVFDGNGLNNQTQDKTYMIPEIPLAVTTDSSENDNGYADEVLNKKKSDGTSLFYFLPEVIASMPDKTGVADGTTPRTKIMNMYNYYALVEPIFWYVPAAAGSDGLPTNPIYSNYVYGTIGNWVDFYETQANKFGSKGGAYTTLMGNLGWSCFYISEDWNNKVIGVTNPDDKLQLTKIEEYKKNNIGFGLHIYTTSPKETDTQITGNDKWTIPAPAPDPTALVASNGWNKEYNIIKYYEDVKPDGTVEDLGGYLTTSNPPKIESKRSIIERIVT